MPDFVWHDKIFDLMPMSLKNAKKKEFGIKNTNMATLCINHHLHLITKPSSHEYLNHQLRMLTIMFIFKHPIFFTLVTTLIL